LINGGARLTVTHSRISANHAGTTGNYAIVYVASSAQYFSKFNTYANNSTRVVHYEPGAGGTFRKNIVCQSRSAVACSMARSRSSRRPALSALRRR
jgi:hypothetical protein